MLYVVLNRFNIRSGSVKNNCNVPDKTSVDHLRNAGFSRHHEITQH